MYEIDNKEQFTAAMMQGDDEQFARWLVNDAKKYGVHGGKFR